MPVFILNKIAVTNFAIFLFPSSTKWICIYISWTNMERFNMNYSGKNMPIPEDYKIQLISKLEKFIKRMR